MTYVTPKQSRSWPPLSWPTLRWRHPVVWRHNDRCRSALWRWKCPLKQRTGQWPHSVSDAVESDPKHAYKQRHADCRHLDPLHKSRNLGHRHIVPLLLELSCLSYSIRSLSTARVRSAHRSAHVGYSWSNTEPGIRGALRRVALSTVGSRTFPVAGPQTRNDFQEDVTSAESLTTFRRLLKTHLFRKSFPDYLLDINWLSSPDLAVVPPLRPSKNILIAWLSYLLAMVSVM